MSFALMCNTEARILKATVSKVDGEDVSTFVEQSPIPAMFDKLSGQRVYINQTSGRTVVAYCRVDITTEVTEADKVSVSCKEWIIDDVDDAGMRGWCKTLKLASA